MPEGRRVVVQKETVCGGWRAERMGVALRIQLFMTQTREELAIPISFTRVRFLPCRPLAMSDLNLLKKGIWSSLSCAGITSANLSQWPSLCL